MLSGKRTGLRGMAAGGGQKDRRAHARGQLVRPRLVVEVEDQIWQRQLFALGYHIVRNLERHLGPDVVEDLEFRVVPRRREPQRAAAIRAGAGRRRSGSDRRSGAARPLQSFAEKARA